MYLFCFIHTCEHAHTHTGTLGDEITSFGNISALGGNASASTGTISKKRKQKVGSKKRGGKKRKFH